MKRNKIFVFFLSVYALLFFIPDGIAQSYYFRNYSVEDGLPFIDVSVIYQDHNGNLWSGGYGGLSKFDGIVFTNYSPKDGLLNHLVTSIVEDNKGNLWIGTISGINKYDGEKFTSYTTKDGLINNSITSSFKDANGDLWFGTSKGITKISNGKFFNYTSKDGLINNDTRCFFQDNKGNIWIGTSEGLSISDGKEFKSYTVSNGLKSNVINGIAQDAENNIWIATANGLCKFNENTFTNYTLGNRNKDEDIKAVIVDAKDVIWLGTDKGLIKFNHSTFSNFPIRKDQNSNIINCFYKDYENNLWIGTYAGLFKYRGNPFISYGIQDGLTNNFIHGITRDSKNNLWVGSQDGLYKFDSKGFYQYNESNGLKAKQISSIYEDTPSALWLATDAGLIIYDGKTFGKNIDTSSIYKDKLNVIYKDSKNNIWIGGNNEIFKYDGNIFQRYAFKSLNENNQVWTFIEDKQGNIWIGTYLGGLIKYDGKTFTECSEQLGFKNDSYLASLIDDDGNLYFGGLDGVWMYNPKMPENKPISFNQSDGMSSDLVYSLTFVKGQNEVWAGTNQGLNQINIAEFKKTGQKNIIPFGKQEGFTGVECNNGSWVDKDGAIWFGTVYGLIKYDPNEYIENKVESKISITGFSLFYNDTILNDSVHLAYSDNNITFKFSGICLTNPGKVKYKYILEGFEKTWSPASKERLANYSNLPPGTYTFKVISSNNENLWNTTPAHFTFTINRPFWKTWQFYVSLILLLSFLLIFSIRYRIRQIKNKEKQKTELNKKIANIESQALRAQMNPHFIFNTMSSIQDYISSNDTDAALKYLSKFAKLMRKIMDNSKQQLIAVAEEINALTLYLELEVMRFDKKFEYHINIDKTIDANYDRIPSMLIQPYVENAIIHGLLPKEGNGKISITLQRHGDTIECTIEDNGIGRTKSVEYKKNRVQQHKSMGMSITQERLDILNSSLKSNIYAEIIDLYENGEPAGTKVKLIIPLETNE